MRVRAAVGRDVIGIIAGVLVIIAARFIERRGVDDPVGAIAVHGVCGTFGVLAVGIFANGQYGAGWNGTEGADAPGRRRASSTTAAGLGPARCRRRSAPS